MTFQRTFTTGIILGVGVSLVAFYVYQRNKSKVDGFLREQGINIPSAGGKDYSMMSLQELMENKEHIEDLISEIELRTQGEKGEPA